MFNGYVWTLIISLPKPLYIYTYFFYKKNDKKKSAERFSAMIKKNSATIMVCTNYTLKGKINFYNRKFGFAIVDKKIKMPILALWGNTADIRNCTFQIFSIFWVYFSKEVINNTNVVTDGSLNVSCWIEILLSWPWVLLSASILSKLRQF